jgi:hypothetical protein
MLPNPATKTIQIARRARLRCARKQGLWGIVTLAEDPTHRRMLPATTSTKKLTVLFQDTTFTVKLFPGTSDRALRAAIANRLRLPVQYCDGSESFYLSDCADYDSLVPLCADGLPDGQTLTGKSNVPISSLLFSGGA